MVITKLCLEVQHDKADILFRHKGCWNANAPGFTCKSSVFNTRVRGKVGGKSLLLGDEEMVSRATRVQRAIAITADATENSGGYRLAGCLRYGESFFHRYIPYGSEFSLCKRAGSKVESESKVTSNPLEIQKNLRGMQTSLVEDIVTGQFRNRS
ncbi:hypothetical protein G9A89_007127 [Geosiphon pyriformis]|nr:hypothetical protein G9A89_007127 [Geosiphon pyriformis]